MCGELRWRRFVADIVARFIPACAGNSSDCPALSGRRTVHPRVCGELPQGATLKAVEAGSSPRVRGTHRARINARWVHRFIPACAGNSAGGALSPTSWPVHPRVCGELVTGRPMAYGIDGSSPRVRGTPAKAPWLAARVRFIPACAGNSEGHPKKRQPLAVHPRVCGELHDAIRMGVRRCAIHPRVCGELAPSGQ